MNEKFYTLPKEKRQAIINAGFRIFSQNTYKNSPMSQIAEAAGISKSLLFYYFRNKKELYLFLWNTCAKMTVEYLSRFGAYQTQDIFESMKIGMKAKIELLKTHPDMGMFALKAFYEQDADIHGEILKSYKKFFTLKASATVNHCNTELLAPNIDLQMMYREMYWAAEGYLWEKVRANNFNVEELEQDFNKLLNFWRSVYSRKG